MIPRNLSKAIKKYKHQYPVIAIVGPRQSGKTTFAQELFNNYAYVSLENLDTRLYAQQDPRGFLSDHKPPLIIDEAQRAPDLFSYLQEAVDRKDKPSQYILTVSQQFLLLEKITQSLAGRILLLKLFPLTTNELITGRFDDDVESIFILKEQNSSFFNKIDLHDLIFKGMYPRIHAKKIDASKWLENYIATYVARDIRSIVNIENLHLFDIFLKTIASFSGQLINYASIANAVGISQPTVKRWMSLLETSGVVFLLSPYYKNIKKRLIKTPKLYFIDTGLLCFLLSIRQPKELLGHPLYGNIFETFVISDLYKRISHIGTIPPLYFFRDRTGNEIDCILDLGTKRTPIEIKASKTYHNEFTTSIKKFNLLSTTDSGLVLYAGDKPVGKNSDIPVIPWWML